MSLLLPLLLHLIRYFFDVTLFRCHFDATPMLTPPCHHCFAICLLRLPMAPPLAITLLYAAFYLMSILCRYASADIDFR